MNLRRRNRAVGEVYSASLNDIMFFPAAILPYNVDDGNAECFEASLPNAKSSTQSVKHPITISVTEDLQYAVNNNPVSAVDLESILTKIIAGQPDPTALLKVDKSVQVQNLVDLLDIGNRLKIKMVLATHSSKK